jgi:hypothetical protein
MIPTGIAGSALPAVVLSWLVGQCCKRGRQKPVTSTATGW